MPRDAKQLRFVSMRPDILVVHPQIHQEIPAPELIRMLRVLLTYENTIDAENDAAQQLHAVVGLLAASGLSSGRAALSTVPEKFQRAVSSVGPVLSLLKRISCRNGAVSRAWRGKFPVVGGGCRWADFFGGAKGGASHERT